MALQSGRVGVAPDQVDVYGRIKGGSPSPTPSGGGVKIHTITVPTDKKASISGFNTPLEDGTYPMADVRVAGMNSVSWGDFLIMRGSTGQTAYRRQQKSSDIIIGNPTGAAEISCATEIYLIVIDYNNALSVELVDKE